MYYGFKIPQQLLNSANQDLLLAVSSRRHYLISLIGLAYFSIKLQIMRFAPVIVSINHQLLSYTAAYNPFKL